jgi:leucyl/phenylalanyl-tRNA---protein transferase
MSRKRITWLDSDDAPDAFPDAAEALTEPNGLLAAGGDLGTQRMLAAYRAGIFPWYENGQPVLWWSPDPRCVLRPADLHVSRRLRRQIRNSPLQLTFDTAFAAVIRACAARRRSRQGTWITPQMVRAFERLHAEGWAHSIEVWHNERLVGGVYGLAMGKVFFGESMFSGMPNTSKIALLALSRFMLAHGMELIDCQVVSPHLLSLGAILLPRPEFIKFLASACKDARPRPDWQLSPLAVADLPTAWASLQLH